VRRAAGSEILTEEVFGPVLTLQTFTARTRRWRWPTTPVRAGGDDVHRRPGRAERVSARLRAGTVWVNCFFVRDLRAPFGGAGLSGIGREGGTWSFDFYAT
jgi:5-carboxymethyl-2-hydroxymuconic-semialdehyde dehydrogenase